MHLVQVVAGLEWAHGGPAYSVPRLNRALCEAGVDARVFSSNVPGIPANDADDAVIMFRRQFGLTFGLRKLQMSTDLKRRLLDPAEKIDILHSHGLWRLPNLYAAHAALKREVPHVVSVRGMLSETALGLSKRSKHLFWTMGQKRALETTACYHATSEMELEHIRRFGITGPIAVVPNGVDLPTVSGRAATRNLKSGLRTLLFLGRIHPIKGIDTLVEAWSRVSPHFPDWRLRIVGPGDASHVELVRRQIHNNSVSRVTLEGAMDGEAKFEAFANADLFVLPSQSENFGLTVAESLACRRPVIVTKGAPWAGVVTQGCGWWVDHGVDAMVAALETSLATPDAELDAMGLRGEAWVRAAFSWNGIGQEMARAYRWLLAQGPRPDCVHE
jgi:glycosyltransferase involved in cell wall biosynthesis